MKLPETIINYIKTEAEKMHHGRIIIEVNGNGDKIDVVVEARERFPVSKSPQTSGEFRAG